MKLGKSSAETGAKMDLAPQRLAVARISTFKRSRSFRASAKFMCKIRSHASVRGMVDVDKKSDLVDRTRAESPDRSAGIRRAENRYRPIDAVYSRLTERLPRPRGNEMSSDLRAIVQDVKNKLSLTANGSRRRRRETRATTDPSWNFVDRSTNRCKNSSHADGAGRNYLNPVDDSYSYENPTFGLDGSFDSSLSGCLYGVDPEEEMRDTDNCGNEFNGPGSTDTGDNKNGRNGEPVTIVIGRADGGAAEETTIERIDDRGSAVRRSSSYRCRSTGKKLPTTTEAELASGSRPLGARGTSFRFGVASTTCRSRANSENPIIGRRGNTGLFAIVPTGSKLQTFHGMEFLEGFGKKKHHQSNQTNSLATNINPLTAQPSLNIHVHALFSAVEHGRLDKARTILESTDVDVNSVNSDCLSPLDVAVLNNDRALANMLVAFGAQEGNRFTSPESLGGHLGSLLSTAERRVQELGGNSSVGSIFEAPSGSCRSGFSTSHNSLTGCGDGVEDKQLALWEKRVRALRKMLLGFDQARPPDTSFHVALDVVGTTSVVLKLQVSDLHDSSIGTKFKVQWCTGEDFANPRGERELLDTKDCELRIDGLVHAQRYHFRAAVGNIKGWSRYKPSTPAYVSPSSWRDLEGKPPRYSDRVDQLETLFSDIRRPEYAQQTSVLQQRRNHKKKTTTIKQLFTATSKFQKNLKRGIFLATLLYHEDKILVTNEDFLPVIEVDETYSPSCIYNDFYWLMKVACTWEDVKSLRQDMEKCQGSSMNHMKLKLLQAGAQMQTALCVQDLGQIYHKPIRDSHGTVVISTVNCIKSPKSVSVLNGRWLPLNKVIKKSIAQDNGNVADILMGSIQSQMSYHRLSSIKLTRGLYLGYLKMQSSVDLVKIFVPAKAPNVLPHCKIRDNPHVSAEEWDYLKRITRTETSEISQREVEQMEKLTNEATEPTAHQKLFVDTISATSRRLFSYMNVNADDSNIHRLYDAEVIELTSQVSIIVIVPPADMACSAPGTREELLQRDDLFVLPIQVFEMVHLSSYHKKMINLYSRLSCILELDIAQAQHNHREAFSSLELRVAKERLVKLQDIQCRVNTIWKEARWLIDLITFARDRTTSGQLSIRGVGISMKNLLNYIDKNKNSNSGSNSSSCSSSSSSSCSSSSSSNNNNGNNVNGHSLKRSLLQLPPRDPKLVKSSPGRGSWPGPNVSNSSSASSCNLLTNELSKSEQQLPNGGASGQYTRKGNVNGTNYASDPLRANEGNGNLARFVPELDERSTLSKSEDSLLLSNYKHSPRNRSVNSLTCPTSTGHSLNAKQSIYGSSFMGVSTSLTGTWTVSSNNTDSDGMHSVNGRDEYSVGTSSTGHVKCKSSKPSASVAAVATPTMENQLDMKKDEATLMPAPLPGILQVYAAYETGLASGTSLKLHVTPRTTAREVVDLVVKQLNMAVVLKGEEGPIYTADELPNFCLVAVIGARERCLRDDFKPLQLQNPWKKGRLYVRQKQDVLAALEHSSKHTAYL